MVPNMKETGKRINNTDKVLKPGQMAQSMMDNMFMERNMDKVDLHGLMEVLILDSLKKTIFKDMVHTIGLMADYL